MFRSLGTGRAAPALLAAVVRRRPPQVASGGKLERGLGGVPARPTKQGAVFIFQARTQSQAALSAVGQLAGRPPAPTLDARRRRPTATQSIGRIALLIKCCRRPELWRAPPARSGRRRLSTRGCARRGGPWTPAPPVCPACREPLSLDGGHKWGSTSLAQQAGRLSVTSLCGGAPPALGATCWPGSRSCASPLQPNQPPPNRITM
jgi:hypothetical protein